MKADEPSLARLMAMAQAGDKQAYARLSSTNASVCSVPGGGVAPGQLDDLVQANTAGAASEAGHVGCCAGVPALAGSDCPLPLGSITCAELIAPTKRSLPKNWQAW